MLDGPMLTEWDRRRVSDVWKAYTEAMEELAATGTCDVLAHPDLVKLTGRFPDPGLLDECHDRIADAAASNGLAAEISSAGFRKPVAEAYPAPGLLDRFFARGVPITFASDAHGSAGVADRTADLTQLARAAGTRRSRRSATAGDTDPDRRRPDA